MGGNLVRLLAREGHEVKALVRSRGKGEGHLGDLLPPSGAWISARVTCWTWPPSPPR